MLFELLNALPSRDRGRQSQDATTVDENLGEDEENWIVDFTGRWHQKGNEGEDDAEGEEHDGGQFLEWSPLPTSPFLLVAKLGKSVTSAGRGSRYHRQTDYGWSGSYLVSHFLDNS